MLDVFEDFKERSGWDEVGFIFDDGVFDIDPSRWYVEGIFDIEFCPLSFGESIFRSG